MAQQDEGPRQAQVFGRLRVGPGGAPPRRQGARAAQRRAEAEANKAVAVELLEILAEGMAIEPLCELLAISQGDVIKVLFMKGIAIQMGQVLDRDTVIAGRRGDGRSGSTRKKAAWRWRRAKKRTSTARTTWRTSSPGRRW